MASRAGVRRALLLVLAAAACYLMYYFSWLANNSPVDISPEGCEMSWMSPHYILQTEFNKSWTPLASRYSLWLYRERGINERDDVRPHIRYRVMRLMVYTATWPSCPLHSWKCWLFKTGSVYCFVGCTPAPARAGPRQASRFLYRFVGSTLNNRRHVI